MTTKATRLAAIATEVEGLTESPLYEFRTQNNYQIVFGAGDADAEIVLIGEAPGKWEAQQGLPFVGASGRVLDEFLADAGLTRDEIYITNVVKDRPPDNRDPSKAEIALYSPFLLRQLEVIQPKVIATLGRFAMDFVFEMFDMDAKGSKISQVHGQRFTAQTSFGAVTVIPLYHPAVSLYNQSQKETLRADFLAVTRER
ncbi:MAG: uracil-DNA glycosylase [Caldilineaceae bacterium]